LCSIVVLGKIMNRRKRNFIESSYRSTDKVATNVMLPVEYKEMLSLLSEKTRIRQSEFLREAVKDLLVKYREVFEDTPHAF